MIAKSANVVWTVLAMTCALAINSVHAANVVLYPSGDTSIFRTSPNNNVGASFWLASGGTARLGPVRMMMRFDVANAIPAGATIQNAQLMVTVTKAPSGGPASTFGLHPLLVDWVEGRGGLGEFAGTGSLALSGETTWNNRIHPSTGWGQAGGQAGVDYVTTASGTALINLGSATFLSTPAMVQDVQSWLDNPADNYGWIAISQSESTVRTARRFGAKEMNTESSRPTLTIEYDLFRFDSVMTTPEGFQLNFMGTAGTSYEVQHRDNFNLEDWLTLTNIGPLEADSLVTVTDGPLAASRFYRLKRLPSIVSQPQPQIVNLGQPATFTVAASGSANLTYQWRLDGIDIEGATANSYMIASVDSFHLGDYTVLVTDGPDSVLSDPATLQLAVAPVIVQHPQSVTNTIGTSASFTVVITNTATLPIRYIWRKNFLTAVATNDLFSRTDTLTIPDVEASDAAGYRVFVSNPVSSTISLEATLTVVE